MKSIAFIIPYFGKLPSYFDLWLHTCKANPDIMWFVFTDDKTEYKYPQNVKVKYIEFDEMVLRIKAYFDFQINLKEPYRLCDFKPMYGEIFSEELEKYDFWGYCDIDVMWGDIRKFITDDVLKTYEKIGFQGHMTLYKNTPEVNSRYKLPVNGKELYKEAICSSENKFFDESGMSDIYRAYNIPFFDKVYFANISPLTWSFYLRYFPQGDDYKNKHQLFTWKNGQLKRLYVYNGNIYEEEFMYIHFLRREMKLKYDSMDSLVIYPNDIKDCPKNITAEYIINHSKNNMFLYYIDLIKRKRNKLSVKNIYNYFSHRRKAQITKKTNNEQIM